MALNNSPKCDILCCYSSFLYLFCCGANVLACNFALLKESISFLECWFPGSVFFLYRSIKITLNHVRMANIKKIWKEIIYVIFIFYFFRDWINYLTYMTVVSIEDIYIYIHVLFLLISRRYSNLLHFITKKNPQRQFI